MRGCHAILIGACLIPICSRADYPVQPVAFPQVELTGGLLAARQATNRLVTLPFALEQLETSGRLKNFDLAAEVMRRRAAGETNFQIRPPTEFPFDDSDVYKAIEGASYCLTLHPDPALAERLEGMIRRIAAAQEPDGYLYTWRTMHPDQPAHQWIGRERWVKDPELSHELYNLGHLFEAGVAHYQATGSRSLLDVCLKSAELLWRDFGDGEPRIAPGHQVIEMGLAKLYRVTGDRRWLTLARFFLDCRGRGGSTYSQDHEPVIRQTRAVGHAVRANYLYSGMADVAALGSEPAYWQAVTRIWDDVVGTKLHVTGGCGARASGEAYGDPYELPHRCYNETCAAVAFLFWSHRMFLMTGEGRYMDAFERTLYNGALSGVSLSGNRFFYPNPLESDGTYGRSPWFGCACCPPNIFRLLASLGGYFYAVRGDELFVNLYGAGRMQTTLAGTPLKLEQSTDYPWEGTVRIRLQPERETTFTLCLRIPGWVRGQPLPSDLYRYDDPTPAPWRVRVNGGVQSAPLEQGYVRLRRTWRPGDEVVLELPMVVRRLAGHPNIAATRGQVALERGPIVYAFEGLDNEGRVFDIVLPQTARIEARFRPDLLGGVTVLEIRDAQRAVRSASGQRTSVPARLTAIPYATWANRELSPMTVWVAREVSLARPAPRPTPARQARLTASFARSGMSLEPIRDQLYPADYPDGRAPQFDFWPHKGTQEWVQYEFPEPAQFQSVIVCWFDDTGTGECRLPESWRLLYRDERGEWQPVRARDEYAVRKGEPVRVRFDPVRTAALRLEVRLPKGFSAGLYEWEVE
ncbi:glycoside hydrolase family 127 protein [Limisphaera sp. VF-2]|jgi:DUF1680 family protein|uniref:glycoside hydrolase family 127 protein n=1 Tax=Limisphaera sp. VF-2 TaxID=3400418 RepID=UPI001759F4FC|nr:glycoside hydrolase family 127 protein [Limisphaera sp.]